MNAEYTSPIRVRESDWKWLMEHRGTGNIPDAVHATIERVEQLEKENTALKARIAELEQAQAIKRG